MEPEPEAPAARAEARARKAYELGLARAGLARAVFVVVLSALAAWVARVPLRPSALALVLAAWTVLGWRRGWWLRGAHVGLLGGLLTLLLPMSLLRPCCPPGAAVCDCCARPSACALVGALLGVALVSLLPRGDMRQRAMAGVGMLLGVVSIGTVRCNGLFAGEALGMLAGLLSGTLAIGGGMWLWTRARSTT